MMKLNSDFKFREGKTMHKYVTIRIVYLSLAITASFHIPAAPDELLSSDLSLDGVVNNFDLAILSDEWLETGQQYTPVTKPFPGPAELRCSQIQNLSVPPGQWSTVLDINDGPAIITNFYFTCNFLNKGRHTPIRIFFDDHNSPDIEGWTGELFACGITEPANFRGRYVGVTNSKNTSTEGSGEIGFSGFLRVAMPYYNSVRIDVQNTSAGTGQCNLMLERMPIDPNRLYSLGLKPGIYLKTYGFGHASNFAQNSEVTIFDSNLPTILAGIYQYFNNATSVGGGGNWDFLTGDFRIYYNGSATDSYQSSGCEDVYNSSYKFQEGLFEYTDQCLAMKNTYYQLSVSRFFPLAHAPYGEEGIKLTWTVGDAGVTTGSTYLRWIIWYYQ